MVTDKKLGFIGAGNMGEALFKGLIATKAAKPEQIFVSARRSCRVACQRRLVSYRGHSTGNSPRVGRPGHKRPPAGGGGSHFRSSTGAGAEGQASAASR